MLDIGASEFLLIVVIAIVAIGPKDLPLALRTIGKWMGNIRRVSGHFRAGVESMIREAELEEMEKKWREQNAAIMEANPFSASAEAALAGDNPGLPMMTPEVPPEVSPPDETAPPKPKRTRRKKPA
jgi:sec-independent protein translocase protein TatB